MTAQTSETPRTDELVAKLDRIGYGAPEQAAITLCDELERALAASQSSLAAERREREELHKRCGQLIGDAESESGLFASQCDWDAGAIAIIKKLKEMKDVADTRIAELEGYMRELRAAEINYEIKYGTAVSNEVNDSRERLREAQADVDAALPAKD